MRCKCVYQHINALLTSCAEHIDTMAMLGSEGARGAAAQYECFRAPKKFSGATDRIAASLATAQQFHRRSHRPPRSVFSHFCESETQYTPTAEV